MSLFLTSTDPEVLGAAERNRDGRRALRERAAAWAEERGSDTYMLFGHHGLIQVAGLPEQPEGFGQWTQPKNRNSKPYRSNQAEQEAMRDLKFRGEPVPGLPDHLESTTDPRTGEHFLMWPTPFVSEGAAWVHYPHQLEAGEREKVGDQWTECLASVFYAAKEALP